MITHIHIHTYMSSLTLSFLQVPEQAWFMHPLSAMMLAGILPFGSVFVELFYIFSALWDGKEYYLFGFLSLVFLIVVVTIAENCVTMCYFYLTNEVRTSNM